MLTSAAFYIIFVSGFAYGAYSLSLDLVNRVLLKSKSNMLSAANFIRARAWWDLYRSILISALIWVDLYLRQPGTSAKTVNPIMSIRALPNFFLLAAVYPIIFLMLQWSLIGGTLYFDRIPVFATTGNIEWTSTAWRLPLSLTVIALPVFTWLVSKRVSTEHRRKNLVYVLVAVVAAAMCILLAVLNGFSSTAALALATICSTFLAASAVRLPLLRILPLALVAATSTSYVIFSSDFDPRFDWWLWREHGWIWLKPSAPDPMQVRFQFVGDAVLKSGPIFLVMILSCIGLSLLLRWNYVSSIIISIFILGTISILACQIADCRVRNLDFLFPVVYIIMIFPIVNGVLDWLSFGFTRYCLYQGTCLKRRRPGTWAIIDICGAILFFVLFGLAFVLLSFFIEMASPASIGATPSLVDWFRNYLTPSNQWVLWSRLTIFLPTLLYASLYAACCIPSLIPPNWTSTVADYIEKNVDRPALMYPVEKAFAIALALAILAATLVALIPLYVLNQLL